MQVGKGVWTVERDDVGWMDGVKVIDCSDDG